MEHKFIRILAITALFGLLPLSTASAYVISSPNGGIIDESLPGTLLYNFDTTFPTIGPTGLSGSFEIGPTLNSDPFPIQSGPFTGGSGVPLNDDTNYLSVANPLSDGTATLAFDQTYDYFGLYWGSMDKYNTLEFLLGGNPIAGYWGTNLSFTGLDVAAPPSGPNGSQLSVDTNRYVNFLDLPNYDGVRFASTSYAFEVDNFAAANVPIPAAVWLLGSGLFGLVLVRRRK